MRSSLSVLLLAIGASFAMQPHEVFGAGVEKVAATAAQQQRVVAVSVDPPTSIEIVLYAPGASEKVLAKTERTGKASFEASVLQNLGTLEVIEESCGEQTRVLLLAANAQAQQGRNCRRRAIGKFAGTDTALSIKLQSSEFIKLGRPPTIPDPPTPAQAQAQARPVQTPATVGAAACPAGAGLIGPKLDLPSGGNTFEDAALLSACTYKGLEDTKQWKYFKVSLMSGQTLKITVRTRDSNIGVGIGRYLSLRLHGAAGGNVGEKASAEASAILTMEYKAPESGFAYLAVHDVVRDSAFQISLQ